MKKNAFTLIELLAVIIILGLLAVLIIPRINDTIKDARKNTDESSAYALVREATNYYMAQKSLNKNVDTCEYIFETNENSCEGLEFTGKAPESGKLTLLDDGRIAMAVRFDKSCFIKEYMTDRIETIDYDASTCGENSYVFANTSLGPTILIKNERKTTNSVEIIFSVKDSESGVKSTSCHYSTDDSYNLEGTIEGNKCLLSNLANGQTYNYKIESENNEGYINNVRKSITTNEFGTIEISISPNVNTFISSRTITISGAVEGQRLQYQLGNSVNEENWIDYTESFEITSNTTVYARLTDGINISDTETYTEDRIDNAPPTVLASNGATDWNINVILSDDGGLTEYAITQSTSEPSSWTSVSGKTSTINTTLEQGTYYVWVKDVIGNITHERIYLYEFVYNFKYSGSAQTFTTPYTGRYNLEVWGAQGGSASESVATGGKGGYSSGTVTLASNNTLYIYAGGKGGYGTTSTYTEATNGGFNGGGAAGYYGGTGGGASDIRIGTDSLYARVIVAGGGGGAYGYSSTYKANGGIGGGTSGTAGSYYSSSYSGWVGGGASQTSGGTGGTGSSANYNGNAGTFGQGGSTGYKYNSTSYYSNGAGGGGWYGGGAAGNYSSSSRNYATGGGGGSGYVYTSETASNYPEGCLLNSSHYLSNTYIKAGNEEFTSPAGTSETGHSGNGYARITYRGLTDTDCFDGMTSPNEYVNFEYTGDKEIFHVCPGKKYRLEVWGAQGGDYSSYVGGKGGYSSGELTFSSNNTLYIYVGGKPTSNAGGFNGGGSSSNSSYTTTYTDDDGNEQSSTGYSYNRGGGGASDIRIGTDSLYARVIVAGGGSGANNGGSGYYGGGNPSGGYSSSYSATFYSAGSNGSFGQGAINTTTNYKYTPAGGGGGWYGGGKGGASDSSTAYRRYHGGGSGWVYTAENFTTWQTNKSSDASQYLLTDEYYLSNASTVAGNTSFTSPSGTSETGHSGNGYARITFIERVETNPTPAEPVVTDPGDCNDGIASLNGYVNFDYTGDVQEFNACAGRIYKLEVWGAQGGQTTSSYLGGKGGYSKGEVTFNSNTNTFVYVGGLGKTGTGTSIVAGGFNGGGSGYTGSSNQGYIGSGGGGTDIRIGTDSLYTRVIVAGGGGGSGAWDSSGSYITQGGYGGGTSGGSATSIVGSSQSLGGGGSQTAAGTNYGTTSGSFGNGASSTSGSSSGGGGGGWYGGGAGQTNGAGGGGGSGYVYTSSTASSYPSGCLLNSSYYLNNASTSAGNTSFTSPTGTSETGHSGNGYARITYVGNN